MGQAGCQACAKAGAGHDPWVPFRHYSADAEPISEFFPMYTVSMDTFMCLSRMEPFCALRARGLVAPASADAVIHFISHEWLGLKHPDPRGVHLRRMQEVFAEIVEGSVLNLFEPGGWQAFAEKSSSSSAGSMRKEESALGSLISGRLTEDVFRLHVFHGEVWQDFSSVPQPVDHKDPIKCKEAMLAAIHSIPAYLERCNYFWVLTPSAKHADKGVNCNFSTWRSRGWCRLEEWGNFLSTTSCPPLIVTHAPMLSTIGFIDFTLGCQGKPHMAPCAGSFTCCQMGHQMVLPCGQPQAIDCDKVFVLQVLSTMYDAKRRQLSRSGSFEHMRALLSCTLEPILLGGSQCFEPRNLVREEETVEEFVDRFALGSLMYAGLPPFGHTAWSLAAWIGHVAMLEKLHSQPEALKLLDDGAMHPATVHCAAMQGHTAALSLLLDWRLILPESLGAAIGADAITALDRASKYGFPRMVELLLQRRASVEPRRTDGSTPLQGAAGAGHAGCCEILLDWRADANATDAAGQTPLHLAADPMTFYGLAEGKPAVLALLLGRRADPALRDAAGRTPLEVARAALFFEGEEVLR